MVKLNCWVAQNVHLGFSIRCYGKDIKILFQSNSILEATLTDLLGTFLITVILALRKTYQQYSDKDVLASKIRKRIWVSQECRQFSRSMSDRPCAFSLGSTCLNLNDLIKVTQLRYLHFRIYIIRSHSNFENEFEEPPVLDSTGSLQCHVTLPRIWWIRSESVTLESTLLTSTPSNSDTQ